MVTPHSNDAMPELSTNPQRSSQQQALLFSIFKKNLVMLVDVVKIGAVPLVPFTSRPM
jgi:hypothetical protein